MSEGAEGSHRHPSPHSRNAPGPVGDEQRTTGQKNKAPVNWPVFIGAGVLIVAFVVWASVMPGQAETVLFGAMDWVATNFGWYYVLTATIVVVFVIIVAFSHVGQIKMGPDHSRPRFNIFTWAAMLFAAGIGVDLMFFGISGPATNYLTPPDVEPLSDEAARMAPIWTIFQYGIPGWAMYALMGMAFGLFAYRYHLPLSIRSALAPIFGRRIQGPVGHAAEIGATIGTISGISVSLGIGVVFLNFGLSAIFGVPNSIGVQIALMALAVFITILSTVSGVEKGIRRLSELNVILAVILMLWVLFTGRTPDLLNALVQNIGDFFSRFPTMMMRTFAYTDGAADYPSDQWMADWTLFFWAWWMAWAPFVSLFLARISRGRTLRQFIIGVLLVPFTFILLWVSIFGNAALAVFRAGNDEFLDLAVNVPESGFFTMLQQYPGATFTISLAVLTGLFFYVTSADSGSLVMANMTTKPSTTDSDGPPGVRIFWAVVTGALTLSMLFIDGVYTLQAATVIAGLPLSILLYLIMISLFKMLRSERRGLESREAARPAVLTSRIHEAGERGSWQQRLRRRMTYASAAQVTGYVNEVAAPAVEDVAAELRSIGAEVSCSRGVHPDHVIPYVDLVVSFPEQDDFKYQAYPVAYSMPNFAANLGIDKDTYYQLEVFSAHGSAGRDIMGYSQEQVITDVLDAYDEHIMYMSMSGENGRPISGVETDVPHVWTDTDRTVAGSGPTGAVASENNPADPDTPGKEKTDD